MSDFRDHWYTSSDGLRLYVRDYPHAAPRATVLCLHGLSRNSADFEDLCPLLNRNYRVIAPDQRGRGRSEYDSDPSRYHLKTYANDMLAMLGGLGVGNVIAIGTSMGGLMTMLLAAMRPGLLQGAVLNDIGPVIESAGLDRIRRYAGKLPAPASWEEAAEIQRKVNEQAFPDYTAADWARFARRTFRQDARGLPVPACDPGIAGPLAATPGSASPDLWPAFAALTGVPTLVIRGELSDLLSVECVQTMQMRKPDLRTVEIRGRGHAPMLDEPEALAAINALLATATG